MPFGLSGRPKIQKSKSLAEQIVDFIMLEVENRVLQPGDFLPTETELTELFGVSRAVVREALAILKQQRIIESKQGGRTRIAENLEAPPFQLLEDPSMEHLNIGYLYELRAALEGEAAELAARRATSEKMADLKRWLDDLEKAVENGENGTTENVAFHKALTEASCNPYIIRFTNWLNNRIRDQIQSGRNKASDRGLPRSVQNEHIAIFEAVRDRKAAQARAAVVKHLKNAAKNQGFDIHSENIPNLDL